MGMYDIYRSPLTKLRIDFRIYYALSVRYGSETIKRLVEDNKYIKHPSIDTRNLVLPVKPDGTRVLGANISDWQAVVAMLKRLDGNKVDVSDWNAVKAYLDQ